MSELEAIAEALEDAKDVLVASHSMADGDSLGSMLAVREALVARGARVWSISNEPVPRLYQYLNDWQAIASSDTMPDIPPMGVVLDCTGWDRPGEPLTSILKQVPLVINIDHHAGNQYFGHLNYVRPQASSTSELVFNLLEEMKVPITASIALSVYTGVVTDTGCFQYENTSPATHRLAARLIEAGVAIDRVHQLLWQEKPLPSLLVLGKALPTLQLAAGGRIAWICVTRDMLLEAGAAQEHCEGMVEYPRSIAGVEVAISFRETSSREVRVGFRSKQVVDVNLLAAQFGGGGHRRAAGCTFRGGLAEAVDAVVKAAEAALEGAV